MNNMLTAVFVLSCAAASSACVTGPTEGVGDQLAAHAAADGTTLIETTPGDAGADPLAHLDLDALDATFAEDEEMDPEATDRAQDAPVAPVTREEFEDDYCPGYNFCLLSRTGQLLHQRWAKRISGCIYADQGNVLLSIRRKRITGWYQVELHSQQQGHAPHCFSHSWLIRRPIKIEVKEATGNRWHLAYEF